ncbi:MAG: hypothetical protein V4668_00545 [Patescibacteria group bacterium]
MTTLHKAFRVLFLLSILAFITPFGLAAVGYGGDAFAQGGWVYSMLAAPFVLATGLFVLASKGKR